MVRAIKRSEYNLDFGVFKRLDSVRLVTLAIGAEVMGRAPLKKSLDSGVIQLAVGVPHYDPARTSNTVGAGLLRERTRNSLNDAGRRLTATEGAEREAHKSIAICEITQSRDTLIRILDIDGISHD